MYKFALKFVLWVFIVTTLVEVGLDFLFWNQQETLQVVLMKSLGFSVGFSILFSLFFIGFIVYPMTKKNLQNVKISIKDFDWSPFQSETFSYSTENWEKLNAEILKLGFQLKKQEENQWIYEKTTSTWSWGDLIVIKKQEDKLIVICKPKFSLNMIDYGFNKVRIENLKKALT